MIRKCLSLCLIAVLGLALFAVPATAQGICGTQQQLSAVNYGPYVSQQQQVEFFTGIGDPYSIFQPTNASLAPFYGTNYGYHGYGSHQFVNTFNPSTTVVLNGPLDRRRQTVIVNGGRTVIIRR